MMPNMTEVTPRKLDDTTSATLREIKDEDTDKINPKKRLIVMFFTPSFDLLKDRHNRSKECIKDSHQ